MLTRSMLRRSTAILAAAILAVAALAAPASAGGHQVCTPDGQTCWIEADTPGGPGGGSGGNGGDNGGNGGGGVANTCEWEGEPLPCWQAGWGYLNESDGCYYTAESPPPPAGDEAWEGHEPGDGAVYRQRCFGDVIGFLVWRAAPPPGQPGTVTPEQLAARAIKAIPMANPQIGIAPRDNGSGLVGLPVWLWIDNTPAAWGPISRTASVPGLSVTAKAEVSSAKWWMGDGTTKACTGPGTPYKPSYGNASSPDCGYRYTKPSAPGRYTVTVTTTWAINWWVVGGGATGTATVFRQSSTTVEIEELQVVTS